MFLVKHWRDERCCQLIVCGFSEAARQRWSRRDFPSFPTTCAPKLRTGCPAAATTGGSGSEKLHEQEHSSPAGQLTFSDVVSSRLAARRSRERRQRSVQRRPFREKTRGTAAPQRGDPHHFCVKSLSLIRCLPLIPQ